MTSLNEQNRRTIALQASGEYLMNHIAGVMDMVQDKYASNEEKLDEETLAAIEAQVKAIAEELTQQSRGHFVEVHTTKGQASLSTQKRKNSDHRIFIGHRRL